MHTTPPDPPFPRLPEDSEELRRLRREAVTHLQSEERSGPAPVYGGPPFGGGTVTRRWTLRRIFLLIAALLAGIGAAIFGFQRVHTPVYGGPPAPPPKPGPNPVYGGPLPPGPQDNLPPKPAPKPHPHRSAPPPSSSDNAPGHRPAAAVYGGPVPRPYHPAQPPAPPQDPQ